MRYEPFGPDAEVFGGGMLAFIKSVNFQSFSKILEKHNLESIDPEKWYPQAVWLDAFTEIANNTNAIHNLVSIGMKIAESAPLPPEVQQMPFIEMMMNFNQSYLNNNRGKDIGGIETIIVDDNHIIMVDKTPYPDDFVYGAYYEFARRFLPFGTNFHVKYDDEVPRREQGGTETRVHITWES